MFLASQVTAVCDAPLAAAGLFVVSEALKKHPDLRLGSTAERHVEEWRREKAREKARERRGFSRMVQCMYETRSGRLLVLRSASPCPC